MKRLVGQLNMLDGTMTWYEHYVGEAIRGHLSDSGLPLERFCFRIDDTIVTWYPSGEVLSRKFTCR